MFWGGWVTQLGIYILGRGRFHKTVVKVKTKSKWGRIKNIAVIFENCLLGQTAKSWIWLN